MPIGGSVIKCALKTLEAAGVSARKENNAWEILDGRLRKAVMACEGGRIKGDIAHIAVGYQLRIFILLFGGEASDIPRTEIRE